MQTEEIGFRTKNENQDLSRQKITKQCTALKRAYVAVTWRHTNVHKAYSGYPMCVAFGYHLPGE